MKFPSPGFFGLERRSSGGGGVMVYMKNLYLFYLDVGIMEVKLIIKSFHLMFIRFFLASYSFKVFSSDYFMFEESCPFFISQIIIKMGKTSWTDSLRDMILTTYSKNLLLS